MDLIFVEKKSSFPGIEIAASLVCDKNASKKNFFNPLEKFLVANDAVFLRFHKCYVMFYESDTLWITLRMV